MERSEVWTTEGFILLWTVPFVVFTTSEVEILWKLRAHKRTETESSFIWTLHNSTPRSSVLKLVEVWRLNADSCSLTKGQWDKLKHKISQHFLERHEERKSMLLLPSSIFTTWTPSISCTRLPVSQPWVLFKGGICLKQSGKTWVNDLNLCKWSLIFPPFSSQLISQEPNQGVEYEYYLPNGRSRQGYYWSFGSWSACSRECGSGQNLRKTHVIIWTCLNSDR